MTDTFLALLLADIQQSRKYKTLYSPKRSIKHSISLQWTKKRLSIEISPLLYFYQYDHLATLEV